MSPTAPSASWGFTKFGTTVIAAPAGGATQKRVGAAATFSDLMTSVDRPRASLVGVVRSVVLGARLEAAGAGVYAGTADTQQFCWSARNDATNWQVDGLNGAGFGYLKAPDGDINGLVCFSAFALAFKSFAVYRLDYTGDSNGFQPSEIGNGGLGIANPIWGGSAVKAGGDVFYFSDLGPCVVYNGETCQLLGGSKIRRYLSDMLSDYGALAGTLIEGTYDPYLGLVAWTIQPHKNADSGERILVVTEIKHGSYDAYTVRFSPGGALGDDRAWLRDDERHPQLRCRVGLIPARSNGDVRVRGAQHYEGGELPRRGIVAAYHPRLEGLAPPRRKRCSYWLAPSEALRGGASLGRGHQRRPGAERLHQDRLVERSAAEQRSGDSYRRHDHPERRLVPGEGEHAARCRFLPLHGHDPLLGQRPSSRVPRLGARLHTLVGPVMAEARILPRHERFAEPPADLAHKRAVGRASAAFAGGGGASGWVVEFTLGAGAGATSTTVTASGVSGLCQVSLEPLTAQAAALLGKVWVPSASLVPNSDLVVGSFTVQHPALLAGVTATFRASVKG